MRVLVLVGLVIIEKSDLAIELAEHFAQHGERVILLDNITRLPIDPERLFRPHYQRLDGDVLDSLPDRLANIDADTVIFAASENYTPDRLFIALDELNDHEVKSFALIDLRTCDCFPHMRELFEDYADFSLHMPYDLPSLLAHF